MEAFNFSSTLFQGWLIRKIHGRRRICDVLLKVTGYTLSFIASAGRWWDVWWWHELVGRLGADVTLRGRQDLSLARKDVGFPNGVEGRLFVEMRGRSTGNQTAYGQYVFGSEWWGSKTDWMLWHTRYICGVFRLRTKLSININVQLEEVCLI
jgi:hypothetical protein